MVEGFRLGVAERLGIEFPRLSTGNPRLIYCSISGFGQGGEFRDLPGHHLGYRTPPWRRAVAQMVRDIPQRLLAADLLAELGPVELPFGDFEQTKSMAKAAAEAVRTGRLGHSLVMATR